MLTHHMTEGVLSGTNAVVGIQPRDVRAGPVERNLTVDHAELDESRLLRVIPYLYLLPLKSEGRRYEQLIAEIIRGQGSREQAIHAEEGLPVDDPGGEVVRVKNVLHLPHLSQHERKLCRTLIPVGLIDRGLYYPI